MTNTKVQFRLWLVWGISLIASSFVLTYFWALALNSVSDLYQFEIVNSAMNLSVTYLASQLAIPCAFVVGIVVLAFNADRDPRSNLSRLRIDIATGRSSRSAIVFSTIMAAMGIVLLGAVISDPLVEYLAFPRSTELNADLLPLQIASVVAALLFLLPLAVRLRVRHVVRSSAARAQQG